MPMINKLLSFLKNIGEKHRQSFDERIESFNDQLAKEIDWGSVSGVNTGYLNRKLLRTSNGSIFFVPSILAVLFPLAFILMGSFLIWTFSIFKPSIQSMLFYPASTFQHYVHFFPKIVESGKIWGQLMGLVFFVIGLVHFYFSVRPITFSRVDNTYSKSFWRKKKIPFHEIHAIQIVSDAGDIDSPVVYEINLVLQNKKRLFVFGHPRKRAVREDAAQLARLLSVAVWDITTDYKERSLSAHKDKAEFLKRAKSYIPLYVMSFALLFAGAYIFIVGSPKIYNGDTVTETANTTNMLNLKPYRYKCVKITLQSGQTLSGYVDNVNKSEYLVLQVIGGVVRLGTTQIASIDELPRDNTQFNDALADSDLYRTLDQMKFAVADFIILADYSNEEPNNAYTSLIWTSNLERAKRSAQLLNKDIFAEFYLSEDKVFDNFHDNIFSDTTIKILIDRNFVPVRIHGTKEDIFHNFGITQLPNLAFLDSSGVVINSTHANMTVRQFEEFVNSIIVTK